MERDQFGLIFLISSLFFLSDLTKLGWLEAYKETLIVWAVAHGIEKRKFKKKKRYLKEVEAPW